MASEKKAIFGDRLAEHKYYDMDEIIEKCLNSTICAVVVTYNRKQLLLECLESLLKQTYPLDAIYLGSAEKRDNFT